MEFRTSEKSTLINSLTGRRIAKVGDRPAITRHAQRFELDSDLSIFDSPGVLWPKLNDQEGAKRLAASGAIRETAFEPIDVAGWAVCFLAGRYAEALSARYKLDDELPSILARTSSDPEDSSRAVELLEAVGRRRGALRSGGTYRPGSSGRSLFARPTWRKDRRGQFSKRPRITGSGPNVA